MDPNQSQVPISNQPIQPQAPIPSPNPTQPSASQPKPGSSLLKITVLFLAIVLILGGAVIYYLKTVKNSPSSHPAAQTTVNPPSTPIASSSASASGLADTTNWQAYEDPTYHFSLKYPSDWIQKGPSYIDNNKYYSVSFSPDPKTHSQSDLLTNPQGIEIRVVKNPNNLTSKAYVEQVYIGQDQYFSQPEMKKQIEDSIKDVKIPGLDITAMMAFAGGPGSIGPQVFIAKDSNIYQIISADHGTSGLETLKTFLSTFKIYTRLHSDFSYEIIKV